MYYVLYLDDIHENTVTLSERDFKRNPLYSNL